MTAQRDATRADLDAVPEHLRAELIEGVLYTMTRPRARHQVLGGELVADLVDPFARGRRGPGGWWIVPEPGIELPSAPEFSPDIAGWRRERLPVLPTEGAITVVPDWACEILSPTTRRHNLLVKRPFYARIGVAWLWMVDVEALTLSVQRLESGRWVEVATYGDERDVRAEPFDAVTLDVRGWWERLGEAG